MIRSLEILRKYSIHATDGNIGSVYDFYFDDKTWTIRYLVIDTGNWLPGRKVLLSPTVFRIPDENLIRLDVSLTKDQIKHSPSLQSHQPVSRQFEHELNNYYGWQPYWLSGIFSAQGFSPASVSPVYFPPDAENPAQPEPEQHKNFEDENHLRSVRDVTGYRIHAKDGDMGHVDDFLADCQSWIIRYVVVNTLNWLSGRKVIVAPQWIDKVSWENSKVDTQFSKDQIKNSPQYDESEPPDRKYEEELYKFYNRKNYWNDPMRKSA
jgi:hypothetical protein